MPCSFPRCCSSPSGFRNEVEREHTLGQLDDVLSYFERHRAGEVLMGPAVPAMAQCRPDRCPNSCIATRHRPLWAKAITDGEELLRVKAAIGTPTLTIELDLRRYRLTV
jgi:hypothetical protein